MRVYAKLDQNKCVTVMLEPGERQHDEESREIPYLSPYFSREDGWYELPRVPELQEYLEYDKKTDSILIKQRVKTPEQIAAERETAIKARIREELPDLIYQYRDNPTALAKALCDRAKVIDVEITAETK